MALTEPSLGARPFSKVFTCVNQFNLQHHPIRSVRDEETEAQRLSNLLKVVKWTYKFAFAVAKTASLSHRLSTVNIFTRGLGIGRAGLGLGSSLLRAFSFGRVLTIQ